MDQGVASMEMRSVGFVFCSQRREGKKKEQTQRSNGNKMYSLSRIKKLIFRIGVNFFF